MPDRQDEESFREFVRGATGMNPEELGQMAGLHRKCFMPAHAIEFTCKETADHVKGACQLYFHRMFGRCDKYLELALQECETLKRQIETLRKMAQDDRGAGPDPELSDMEVATQTAPMPEETPVLRVQVNAKDVEKYEQIAAMREPARTEMFIKQPKAWPNPSALTLERGRSDKVKGEIRSGGGLVIHLYNGHEDEEPLRYQTAREVVDAGWRVIG